MKISPVAREGSPAFLPPTPIESAREILSFSAFSSWAYQIPALEASHVRSSRVAFFFRNRADNLRCVCADQHRQLRFRRRTHRSAVTAMPTRALRPGAPTATPPRTLTPLPDSDGSWEGLRPGSWLQLPWRVGPGLPVRIRYSFRRPSTGCPSIKQYSCRTSAGLYGKRLEVSRPEPTR